MNLFFSTVRTAFSGKLAIITLAVSFAYLFLPGILLNYKLLIDTLFSSSSLVYKVSLTFQILLGYIAMSQGIELVLLLITAFLLGINISLLVDSISHLRHAKRLTLSLGGSTIVGLAASGCASCGVSLLSVLGISSSFLALHNNELYIFSIALLILSLLVTANTHAKVCKIH